MPRPTPCECIDDYMDRQAPGTQRSFLTALVAHLGGNQWMVCLTDGATHAATEWFGHCPPRSYTDGLRDLGYTVAWEAANWRDTLTDDELAELFAD